MCPFLNQSLWLGGRVSSLGNQDILWAPPEPMDWECGRNDFPWREIYMQLTTKTKTPIWVPDKNTWHLPTFQTKVKFLPLPTFILRVTFVLFGSLPIYQMQLIILNWWDRYIGGAPWLTIILVSSKHTLDSILAFLQMLSHFQLGTCKSL